MGKEFVVVGKFSDQARVWESEGGIKNLPIF